MNRRLLDPFKSVGLPETIDEYLHHGTTTCYAFNRRGTLLAAGTKEGQVVYWDMDTRGVARVDSGHSAEVTSVCWTRDGRFLVSLSKDRTVIVWDVLTGKQEHTWQETKDITQVAVHPLHKHELLLSFKEGDPVSIDLTQQSTKPPEAALQWLPSRPSTAAEKLPKSASIIAVFSKCGKRVYAASSRGQVFMLRWPGMAVLDVVKVPGMPKVTGLCVSRKGDKLLLNCSDKVIRLYTVSPEEPPVIPESDLKAQVEAGLGIRHGSMVGRSLLTWQRDFSNAVERVQWQGVCFSSDGEYVVGAAGTSNEHNMYIWNCMHGKLERILEGPKPEGVHGVLWHPLRSALVSLATSGKMFIWTKIYQENWSAFAPGDFQELEENQEYVEREDEFDYNDIEERVAEGKRLRHQAAEEADSDEEVDIVAAEHVAVFSSDDEGDTEGQLHYLPVRVEPDEAEAPPGAENGGVAEEGAAPEEEEDEEEEDLEDDDDQDNGEALLVEGPRKRKMSKYLADTSDYVPLPDTHFGGRRRKS